MKIRKNTIFGHFDTFSSYRVWGCLKPKGTQRFRACRKWENSMFLCPKCGLQGGAEKCKNGHCQKPLSNPRGWCKNCTLRGQKNSRKSALFEETVKIMKISTFSGFLCPGQNCQNWPWKRLVFRENGQNVSNKCCFLVVLWLKRVKMCQISSWVLVKMCQNDQNMVFLRKLAIYYVQNHCSPSGTPTKSTNDSGNDQKPLMTPGMTKNHRWLRNAKFDKSVKNVYMCKGKVQKCKMTFFTEKWCFPQTVFLHKRCFFYRALVFSPGQWFSHPGSGFWSQRTQCSGVWPQRTQCSGVWSQSSGSGLKAVVLVSKQWFC